MTEHHRTEDRVDLEQRFMLMGGFLQRARELACMEPDCEACMALQTGVPLPFTLIQPGQEPREDLEEAVDAINERLTTIVASPGSVDCAGRAYVMALNDRATELLEDQDDAD